jgi:peptidoglycan-N-acetylglucosamine deacetylase
MNRRVARLLGSLCLAAVACDAHGSAGSGDALNRLPLVEVPASHPGGHTLALVMSGDGNWADLIESFSRTLADSGIAVVGLDSRSYLDHARTPDEIASDMVRVLRAYLTRWQRDDILIAGYSRGADLAPFVVARLPDDLRARVRLVALLSPATTANFHFHLIDLVRTVHRPDDVPVLPELARMGEVATLCVYGREETGSLCTADPAGRMHAVAREGGHRTTDHALLARLVLTELRTLPPRTTANASRP